MSQPMDNDVRPLQASRASRVGQDGYSQYAARYNNPYATYPPSMALLPPSMHTPDAYLTSYIGSTNANAYPNNNSNYNTATSSTAPVANRTSAAHTAAVEPSQHGLTRPATSHQPYPSMTPTHCPLCGTAWSTYAELMQHMANRHADYTGNFPFLSQYAQHSSMFPPTSPNAQPPSFIPFLVTQQQSLMQQSSQPNDPVSAGIQPQPKPGSQMGLRPNTQSTPYSPPHMPPMFPSVPPLPVSPPLAPPTVGNALVKQTVPDAGRAPSVQKNPPPNAWSDKNIECHICNIFCSTQDQLDIHFNGHKHKKRAVIYNDFMKASQSFDRNTISARGPGSWYCSHCRATLDSMNSVLQHLESVKHCRYFGPSPVNFVSNRANNAAKDKTGTVATTAPHGSKSVLIPETPAGPSVAQPARASALSSNRLAEVMTVPPVTSPSSIQNDVLKGLKALSANKPSVFPSPIPTISKTRCGEVKPLDVANAKIASVTAAAHRTASLSCIACNVTCNSTESLVMHLASQRHKRRVVTQSGTKAKPNVINLSDVPINDTPVVPAEPRRPVGRTQSADTTPTRPDVDMFCEVCRVPICGRRNYEAHMRGKLHARNSNMKKIAEAPMQGANAETQNEQRPSSPSLSSNTKNASDKGGGDNIDTALPHCHDIEENSDTRPGGTETQQEEVQGTRAENSNGPEQEVKEVSGTVEEGGSKTKSKEGDSGTTESTSGLAQLATTSQAVKKAPVRRKRAGASNRTVVEKSGTSPNQESSGVENSKSTSPNRSGRRSSIGDRGIKHSRGRSDAPGEQHSKEGDSANEQTNS